MKKLHYIIVSLIFVFSIACNQNKNNEKRTKNEIVESELRVVKKYTYEDIDVYYVNPKLYTMLDSIIENVRKCPELQDKHLVYYISMDKTENSSLLMSIDLYKQKDLYCPEICGVFLYKKTIFVLGEIFQVDNLFINTGLKTKFKCQKENILMCDYNDFTKGGWTYIIENGKWKCISYGFCGQIWRDERYYKSQE